MQIHIYSSYVHPPYTYLIFERDRLNALVNGQPWYALALIVDKVDGEEVSLGGVIVGYRKKRRHGLDGTPDEATR